MHLLSKFRKNVFTAFTIAEVLIVLGIIGVVAEMTIPALYANFHDTVLKTTWRKGFSIISQATMMIINDNGGNLVGVFTSTDQIKDIFKRYLIKTRECNTNDICAINGYELRGTPRSWGPPEYSTLYLNDGSKLLFTFNSSNCSVPAGSSGINSCAGIIVDVNGDTKPNTVGKDIYLIWIQSNRVVPAGVQGDAGNYDSAACPDNMPSGFITGNAGWGCSAKYLIN